MKINHKTSGFKHFINAASYSMSGFKAAWTEAAFRQESTLMLVLVPLSFFLGQTGLERALLLTTCIIVIITELLNSAIETVVDRVGLEQNELSARAKDLGSAAVFSSLALVFLVWALIFCDRFLL